MISIKFTVIIYKNHSLWEFNKGLLSLLFDNWKLSSLAESCP